MITNQNENHAGQGESKQEGHFSSSKAPFNGGDNDQREPVRLTPELRSKNVRAGIILALAVLAVFSWTIGKGLGII